MQIMLELTVPSITGHSGACSSKCDGLMCFHKCSFYLHTELIEKGIEINKDGVAAMGTVAEFKCLEQIAQFFPEFRLLHSATRQIKI